MQTPHVFLSSRALLFHLFPALFPPNNHAGLPFYDILLLDNLPKGAGLPVGTTQRTKAKLQSGEWPFEYVFYTESDQILISRQLPMMYDHLKKYPGMMQYVTLPLFPTSTFTHHQIENSHYPPTPFPPQCPIHIHILSSHSLLTECNPLFSSDHFPRKIPRISIQDV